MKIEDKTFVLDKPMEVPQSIIDFANDLIDQEILAELRESCFITWEKTMKKINSKKELVTEMYHKDSPYDVDEHFAITDVDYEYPIWVEFLGTTHLGDSYKVRTKKQMQELKRILDEVGDD